MPNRRVFRALSGTSAFTTVFSQIGLYYIVFMIQIESHSLGTRMNFSFEKKTVITETVHAGALAHTHTRTVVTLQ